MPFQFGITAKLHSWRSSLLRPFWALFGRRPSSNMSPLGQEGPPSMDSTTSGIPSSQHIYEYDVFISFRGTDIRNTFADHLYNHLIRKGLSVFKDDKKLHKGELISPQLIEAIQHSRVSIIVFSKDYASSAWCLEEMATIAECHRQFDQTVFPVFYDVDPSHVRNLNGVYENAFALHTEKYKHDLVPLHRWKKAMRDFGNSVGWDARNKPEFAEIENIVQTVINRVGHKFSGFADDLIGIQPRVEALERILKLSSENDNIRVLGIWGMGGIGKTTHATALYDRISYQFAACCFIEDVSKIYRDGNATAVHKQILLQTLGGDNLETRTPSDIAGMVRNRLHNIKVLLVLDNVDDSEQLTKLAINPNSLLTGSRMIITTRDKHILEVYDAQVVYEVPLLNDNDARELFCKKAFKSEDQSSECVELIPEVLKYAQHLPLAIKVLGSFLCTRDVTQWRDALDRLRNSPDNKIMDVLQLSVDELPYEEKEIFLHIACFFRGEREDFVKRILDACGLHPHIGIKSMIEKSLVTIRNKEIHMHGMLQDLGKKIVRQQHPKKPECWSRLWLYKDFYHVLTTEAESDNVEAIALDPKEDISKCCIEGLSKMRSLRMLILYHNKFSGSLKFLSNNLQYLLWHSYPFASLPTNFEPLYLVELNMPNSSVERLWEGPKDFPFLKRVDLNNSKNLAETPNFRGSPRLERLDFTGCTNLLQVHSSIGLLSKLVFLSLRNCNNLAEVDFGYVIILSNLIVLHLSGCSKLKSTPDFTGILNLEYLDIDGCTSLSKVHESIGALTKLRFLSLRDCTNLDGITSSINTMTSLITLDLWGCPKLEYFPLIPSTSSSSSHLKSLIYMDLSFCNLREVPDAIGQLVCLERLNLQGNKFVYLPYTIRDLSCLAYLNLAHCHELKYFPTLSTESASSVGRYFETASGSRDHRSGLYIFDCPRVYHKDPQIQFKWLKRLLKQPHHFRCGFDIVLPSHHSGTYFQGSFETQRWFSHIFTGDSVARVAPCNVDDNWFGFVFSVEFEVKNRFTIFGSPHQSSSSPLPHPFYLSLESECVEESFGMPLNLELDKIDGSQHIWTIYISRQHCHFIETGAHITFKACPGLVVKEWGLRRIVKQDIDMLERKMPEPSHEDKVIGNVRKSSTYFGPKIQLPYNWLISEEDEVENLKAKAKENNFCNRGL